MTPAYSAKYERRARAVVSILRWPLFGALFAAGALAAAHAWAPPVARELGAAGGEGFAAGARRVFSSGQRGVYR